ncbi:MAG: hypothetical protein WC389_15705 [Lutibacter sp.]|jgi:hypothetical protein
MALQRNPNSGKWSLPSGYTDLGWQRHSGECKEIADALAKGYKIREFDNSLYQNRCTDVVNIIDDAKIVWHIDMSD